ncbi:unnamed protein product [Closterium sp. Yama58-4]|nr:unnamed protein product [Closterium sp. Yama58-4]
MCVTIGGSGFHRQPPASGIFTVCEAAMASACLSNVISGIAAKASFLPESCCINHNSKVRYSNPVAFPSQRIRKTTVRASNEVGVSDELTVTFPKSKLVVPYPDHEAKVYISREESPSEVASAVAEYIQRLSAEATKARGAFTVALSGGSLVNALLKLTEEPFRSSIDWKNWHVLWVDERVVKLSSPDSNYKLAMDEVLSKVPIPEEHIYSIDDELSVVEAASDYEELMKELVEEGVLRTTQGVPFPRIDLILLGFGPDGHMASLFPNSPLLRETSRWVLPVTNSPKPPPERITMTLPVINCASNVAFVAAGKGKAEVVQRIFGRLALPGALPAQLVRPYSGPVTWFVDSAAASKLPA